MTVGLQIVLHFTVGALCQNTDIVWGLVNGAIGTITAISACYFTVKFDQNGVTSDIE